MIYAILIIIGAIALYFFFRVYIASRQSNYNRHLKSVLLRVAVSKTNERGPIVAEQIFSAIHGIRENYGFFNYLAGETAPRISLEIANVGNKIQFFIWSPRRYKNVIESQIYAQYPDVEIEEVEDYARQNLSVLQSKTERRRCPKQQPRPIRKSAGRLPAERCQRNALCGHGRIASGGARSLSHQTLHPI